MSSLTRIFVRGLTVKAPFKSSSARVAGDESGMRIDRWIALHLPRVPHSLVQKLLRKRKIFVSDTTKIHTKHRVESSNRVHEGQYIHFPSYFQHSEVAKPTRETELSAAVVSRVREWVLYRDEHLLVLNKPPGLSVQGGSKLTHSLASYLSALAFDGITPRLVHRLDQHASGVLVLARSRQVAQQLSLLWSEHRLMRLYWAVLIGQPKQMTGVIDKPLLRLSDRVVLTDAQVTGVKQAITHYDVLTTARHMSLVALRPFTGRTHQLRVHCASVLNSAIFGDGRYSPDRLPAPVTRVIKEHSLESKLHLHARELCFKHPVSGQMLHFTAALPAHMEHTLTQLNLAPDLAVASRAQLTSEDFDRVERSTASVTRVNKKRSVKTKSAKKKRVKKL